jgi:hypothetical protein
LHPGELIASCSRRGVKALAHLCLLRQVLISTGLAVQVLRIACCNRIVPEFWPRSRCRAIHLGNLPIQSHQKKRSRVFLAKSVMAWRRSQLPPAMPCRSPQTRHRSAFGVGDGLSLIEEPLGGVEGNTVQSTNQLVIDGRGDRCPVSDRQ